MSAAPFDPRQLAEAVAKAILGAIDPEADWGAMDAAEQSDILLAAHAAVGAHDQWLTGAGFKIVPPGMVRIPRSDEEADAHRAAVRAYVDGKGRKSKLIGSPALIVPPGARH